MKIQYDDYKKTQYSYQTGVLLKMIANNSKIFNNHGFQLAFKTTINSETIKRITIIFTIINENKYSMKRVVLIK